VPVDAPQEALFQRHRHLGIDRAVIVQASCHGTDNAAMMGALKAGGDRYRGVAVVVKRLGGGKPLDVYRRILTKIKSFGWHLIVYFDAEDLEELTPFLESIEVPVVVDHMGVVPVEQGLDSTAFKLLHRLLLGDEKFWVKISCPERLSKTGPPYFDVDHITLKLLESVPDRVLWGTDWPHPNMKTHIPDDGQLVDRIMRICDTSALRQKVLIDNPTRLYWTD